MESWELSALPTMSLSTENAGDVALKSHLSTSRYIRFLQVSGSDTQCQFSKVTGFRMNFNTIPIEKHECGHRPGSLVPSTNGWSSRYGRGRLLPSQKERRGGRCAHKMLWAVRLPIRAIHVADRSVAAVPCRLVDVNGKHIVEFKKFNVLHLLCQLSQIGFKGPVDFAQACFEFLLPRLVPARRNHQLIAISTDFQWRLAVI